MINKCNSLVLSVRQKTPSSISAFECRTCDTTHIRRKRKQMEIQRNGSKPSARRREDYFTGTVRIDSPFQGSEAARISGAIVTFEPGARTAWHTHPLGQTLIVTAGCGRPPGTSWLSRDQRRPQRAQSSQRPQRQSLIPKLSCRIAANHGFLHLNSLRDLRGLFSLCGCLRSSPSQVPRGSGG